MKTFFISAILLFFVSVGLKAQTIDTTLVITFNEQIHDYGKIQQGADGTCEFKFKNTGKTPLILSNVRASCGCTVPSWTQEPVQPGKEGVIKVSYNTQILGIFNKSITVNSNAKNSEVYLAIKGEVLQKTQ